MGGQNNTVDNSSSSDAIKMPGFGKFFKKAFSKGAGNLMKQCGAGEQVADMVEDAVEDGFDQVNKHRINSSSVRRVR